MRVRGCAASARNERQLVSAALVGLCASNDYAIMVTSLMYFPLFSVG